MPCVFSLKKWCIWFWFQKNVKERKKPVTKKVAVIMLSSFSLLLEFRFPEHSMCYQKTITKLSRIRVSVLTNNQFAGINRSNGGMPERLNGTVSKTVVGVTPPRVRIPVPPPVVIPKKSDSINTPWDFVFIALLSPASQHGSSIFTLRSVPGYFTHHHI